MPNNQYAMVPYSEPEEVVPESNRYTPPLEETGPGFWEKIRGAPSRARGKFEEVREERRLADLERARERGERKKEAWEASAQEREIKIEKARYKAELEPPESEYFETKGKSGRLRRAGRASRSRKAERRVGTAVGITTSLSRMLMPAQPKKRSTVPRGGMFDVSGMKKLTMPRPKVGQVSTGPTTMFSLGSLANLRQMMIPGMSVQQVSTVEQRVPSLSDTQSKVYSAIREGHTDIDSLEAVTGLKSAQINRSVKALGKKGLIKIGE